MCHPRFLLSLGLVVATAGSLPAIEKPLGYERFTPLTVESGVFVQLTPAEVYDEYAKPLTLGVTIKNPVRDKRLIDVETHRDDAGKLTLSGVWIENTGDFETESWLLLGLTYGDLLTFAAEEELWTELIPLDIERYENKKGQLRWAVIFQRNVHKAHWLFKPDVTYGQIKGDAEEYRLVDFDRYTWSCSKDGQACIYTEYDAIMVLNSGPHFVNWSWSGSPDFGATPVKGLPFSIIYFTLFGMQAVDIEEWDGDGGTILYVDTGRDFALGGLQTAVEAALNGTFYGTVIDLEGGPAAMEGYKDWTGSWHTVFCGAGP